MAFPCWKKFKDTDLHKLLAQRTKIAEPITEADKVAYKKAAQELQNETLNDLHNVFHQAGVPNYKQPIEKAAAAEAPKESIPSVSGVDENKKVDFIEDMESKGFELDNGEYKRNGVGLNIKRETIAFVGSNGEVAFGQSKSPKDIVLNEIKINDEDARGSGEASKALDDFLDSADKQGYTIYIEPTPIKKLANEKNLTKEQLVKWYEKRGFEKKNDAIWVRKPQSLPKEQINQQGNETPIKEVDKSNQQIKQSAEKGGESISEPKKEGEGTGAVTKEETVAAEGGQPPISEPPKKSLVFSERPSTELSHRGLQDVANEFSLSDVEVRDRKSDVQLRQDAINTANDWAEKGQYAKNVEGLVRKAEGGEVLTDEQRVILERHLANLSKDLRDIKDKNSPEFDAKLAEIKRLKDAGEKTRSEAGAALRVPMGGSRPQDIADFLVEEMDKSGVEKLTENQKETAIQEFETISEAKKKFDEYMAAKEAELVAKQAKAGFEKQKAVAKKTKKTHEEHVEYRKKVIEDIREKLKQARGETSATVVPYAKELFAIAPDVGKLVKDLLDEGFTKLEDVVKNIHGQLKEFIPEIKEGDVNDLIAGSYNEKKKTRSELAARAMDLKIEANLINKLDALERGEEPKSEKQKIQRNKEITDLRNKIKNVEAKKTAEENKIKNEAKAADKAKADAIKEEEKFIREFEKEKDSEAKKSAKAKVDEAKKLAASLDKKTKEESALQSIKTRMVNEIKQIENQISTGNFEKAVVPAKQPILLDKEGNDLRDNLIKLRQKRELRLLLQQRQNEGIRERSLRMVAEVANIPRTLMTIADFSGLLRQNLFFSLGHPLMTSKALPGMFKSFTSQTVYDRWFADLKESPRYELIKDTKLAIADSLSHDLTQREESFMSSLAEKIPIIGQTLNVGGVKVPGLNIVKGSERSYTMLLNKMRVDVFNYFVDSMENRGITYENSPKVYKAVAEYVNNATGRSDFGKTLNRIAPILNSAFFSPRLIASRINMLTYWAQPRFWKTLPREVRIDYFRNWVSLLAVGGTVLALAQLGGATVEDDPRSSDFGKIKDGNTRWDIWGGAQPYVRVMAQLISGKRKSTKTGKIYDLSGKDIFGETRSGVVSDFFRNKLAPVPASAIDILSGRTSIGDKIVYEWNTDKDKEVSIRRYIQDRVIPMTITGTAEAMKDQGVKSLLTVGVPNAFGVGTQTYESGKKNK